MTHPLLFKFIVAAVIVWWLWSDDAPGARVSKELVIDDDVYSPTFGYAVVPSDTRPASSSTSSSREVQDAIEASSAAIDEYVVPSNPWGIT